MIFPVTLSGPHGHPDAVAFDSLAGTDFCGLAAFRLAVNADFTRGHHVFALSSAAGNADEFQQIAQSDVLIIQLKFADFHARPVNRANAS